MNILSRLTFPAIVILILRGLGWSCVIAIAMLSLVPGNARPHVVETGQLEHIAAYAGTAALLAAGYSATRQLVGIAVLLPAYAVALEAIQFLVPGRTAQIIDIIASSVGAWAGLAFMVLLLAGTSLMTIKPTAKLPSGIPENLA